MSKVDVLVPDIGDFSEVELIDILVKVGDKITKGQDIITLESDKAAMEIPSSATGKITSLNVAVGDKVSAGSLILSLEQKEGKPVVADAKPKKQVAPVAKPKNPPLEIDAEVLVIGSGPGGYTAAFRAADLGKKVVLVERHDKIGGVCLNVGCIPSKALLRIAQVINEAKEVASHGVSFKSPDIDVFKIADYKNSVVNKLTAGLKALAKRRKVKIIQGEASFVDQNTMKVITATGEQSVKFANCIIATGSRSTKIPSFPHDDPRMMNSTDALKLAEIPDKLLVIGGGIIGLEMATVYHTLGSEITIVEQLDTIIPEADKDLSKPLLKKLQSKYQNIFLNTKVSKIKAKDEGLKVWFDGAVEADIFDKVLVAVGRTPNGKLINAQAAGVYVDERGFITVNSKMQTNINHIYAIGDIVGQPMLAHKASHEAKVAAEVICGLKSEFKPMAIPSVAYTDPEIAWMGITEQQAKEQGISFVKAAFPWAASGRSLSIGRSEGVTKALFDKQSGKLIGAGITGTNAGELIAEAVLALELGADAEDLGKTIHPHPTLSETLNFAAEMAEGSITDLLPPRKHLHSKD